RNVPPISTDHRRGAQISVGPLRPPLIGSIAPQDRQLGFAAALRRQGSATMYALKSVSPSEPEQRVPRDEDIPAGGPRDAASGEPSIVIYLDRRAFTRDCVGGWPRSSRTGCHVLVPETPDHLETAAVTRDRVQAVIVNVGLERMSSATVADLLSRLGELFPDAPVAVLSDHEDADNVREALSRGVQGYIPTSLPSRVAIGAVH